MRVDADDVIERVFDWFRAAFVVPGARTSTGPGETTCKADKDKHNPGQFAACWVLAKRDGTEGQTAAPCGRFCPVS